MKHDQGGRKPLPISPFQNLMIATALDPETHPGFHDLMTINWGCKLQPGVSPRVVRRVFDKIVERHDSLRLRFVQHASQWGAHIEEKHPTGLIVNDISGLSQDAQNDLIAETAALSKNAFSPSLFDMHLFVCGPLGSVILVKAHHSVMDGYGLIILLEEILKSFLNVPAERNALSHQAFIRHVQKMNEQSEARNKGFWNAKLFPLPEQFRVAPECSEASALSSRNMVESIALNDIFTPSQSKEIEDHAKRNGITDFSLIYAAFAKALCKIGSRDEVLIYSSLPRHDAALSTFIGCCIQNVAIRFSKDWGDATESAKMLQSEMQNAIDHVPVDVFFSLDSDVNAAITGGTAYISTVRVHRYAPTGRLAHSPFRKIFEAGATDSVSFGGVSIQPLQWPGSGLTLHEIFLSVTSSDEGPNATLVARADVCGTDDLTAIAAEMVSNLMV